MLSPFSEKPVQRESPQCRYRDSAFAFDPPIADCLVVNELPLQMLIQGFTGGHQELVRCRILEARSAWERGNRKSQLFSLAGGEQRPTSTRANAGRQRSRSSLSSDRPASVCRPMPRS